MKQILFAAGIALVLGACSYGTAGHSKVYEGGKSYTIPNGSTYGVVTTEKSKQESGCRSGEMFHVDSTEIDRMNTLSSEKLTRYIYNLKSNGKAGCTPGY